MPSDRYQVVCCDGNGFRVGDDHATRAEAETWADTDDVTMPRHAPHRVVEVEG